MKLTEQSVRALKLDGKTDLIVFDDDMPGFGFRLRLSAGGKVLKSWVCQYKRAGLSRRVLLGSAEVLSPSQARPQPRRSWRRSPLAKIPQATGVLAATRTPTP
jgi:hypothetical protein